MAATLLLVAPSAETSALPTIQGTPAAQASTRIPYEVLLPPWVAMVLPRTTTPVPAVAIATPDASAAAPSQMVLRSITEPPALVSSIAAPLPEALAVLLRPKMPRSLAEHGVGHCPAAGL